MFGLKMVTKTEIALWKACITDAREEIAYLKAQLAHQETVREALMNLVLLKSTGAVLTPSRGPSEAEMESIQKAAYDLFGEAEEAKNEEYLRQSQILEGIQK